MRINNPKTGEYMNTRCLGGCYCHSMAMQFGDDADVCQECGCPKTKAGWDRLVATGAKVSTPTPEPPKDPTIHQTKRRSRMKKLLTVLATIVTLGMWHPSAVLTIHAQTLPVTRTLAWDQVNATTDSITGYTVVLDGVTLPIVPPCTPDPLACTIPLTFTTAGTHNVSVTATNLWGTSVPATLVVNVVVPGKSTNVRIK